MASVARFDPIVYQEIVASHAEPPPLPPRELEVLSLVAEGAGNCEIAERLAISPTTVASRIYELKMRLRARTRLDLVVIALQRGLLTLPPGAPPPILDYPDMGGSAQHGPHAHAQFLASLVEPPQPSPRQLELLALIAEGLGNREIAERLSISSKTVTGRIHELKMRLQAWTRMDLVAIGLERGLLPPRPVEA